MVFVSTRGDNEIVTSAVAINRGLAADGGLFVPQELPQLTLKEIMDLQALSYQERAVYILKQFLTDYAEEELRECVNLAYTKEKFADNPVPLVQVGENTGVLELWHGPTSAFKDMALQLLPHLLLHAKQKTGELHQIVILVATSGDTGKAALEGFADVPGTEIMVFYPSEGVSDIQKRQMTTQEGANVKVFGIEGNFDDAQRGVKEIFSNKILAKSLAEKGFVFSSANSINWGRLVPQIVYYFSAYVDAVAAKKIKAGELMNFVVPTGNFGDILAGYYAKKMGLPVKRLLCASNSNNVLTDFINTGIYDKRREFFKTASPSMDILVSSNLERLLYHVSEEDSAKVAGYMEKLNKEGFYEIERAALRKVRSEFFGAWVDEFETSETISRVYDAYGYVLDPHTAVAWRALEKYRYLPDSDATYTVVLSTASPFKFANSVLSAIEKKEVAAENPFDLLRALSEKTGLKVPAKMSALEAAPILHKDVVEASSMELTVISNI